MIMVGCARDVPRPPGEPATQRPYTIRGRTYHPLPSAHGFSETGVASWYGPDFHGKRTSNGEVYDMEAMTAAHKLLPMNTWVRVTNLDNDRQVDVRVNDRGPFVSGRVIDLSKAAARDLGMIGKGTARVRVAALGFRQPGKPGYQAPRDFLPGPFGVQVGAFVNESNAFRLAARLRSQRKEPVTIVQYDDGQRLFHRVRVGRVKTLDAARELEASLRQSGFPQAITVAW